MLVETSRSNIFNLLKFRKGTDMQIVLASASPRRADLLRKIGLQFKIQIADIDEKINSNLNPSEQVKNLARHKAQAVASKLSSGLVLGADTIVVKDNEVLGKPGSPDEARQMLSKLSGCVHQVLTGVALIDAEKGKILIDFESTLVYFRKLSEEEISAYVKTGEPLDKAGAYGIQEKGATLVERIEGCYFNVVGLPIVRVIKMFKQMGLNVFNYWQ